MSWLFFALFVTLYLLFPYVTQSGPDITAEETLGVNYRSLNDLFDISQNRSDTTTYDVKVQMIEIYNEQVRDLLMTDGANKRYPSMISQKCLFHVGNVHIKCILLYAYFPCFSVKTLVPTKFLVDFSLTKHTLEIRNNSHVNGLNIPDANLVPVKCTKDVLDLMKVGIRNRAVGATALNERSSRSHRY